jgi:hypothetical protein
MQANQPCFYQRGRPEVFAPGYEEFSDGLGTADLRMAATLLTVTSPVAFITLCTV